jgi:hypothetical protein
MLDKQDETIKVIKVESEKTRGEIKSAIQEEFEKTRGEIRVISSKLDKTNVLLERDFRGWRRKLRKLRKL